MSRGDGKDRKFRILCKKCNSYMHTTYARGLVMMIHCANCDNTAASFEDEFGATSAEEEAQ